MNVFIESRILPLLATVDDPVTGKGLLASEAITQLSCKDGHLSFELNLPYPCNDSTSEWVNRLGEQLLAIDSVEAVDIDTLWRAPTPALIDGKKPIEGVKNVIAVASGKGGVGKSTTTVNLALAMAALGAKVGILDADIYGPSQPQMLGVADKRPEIRDQKVMLPIIGHGIQSMSMGFLLSEKTPAVWRGPMATGALNQLIFQTAWDDVDYLFVDMPPGTGDIQLSLSQQVPVTGAVVVTTPQDIALLDAQKAIEMFTKVNVPILGVVENMAVHHCSQCGHEEHIFGEGGGERIAQDYGAPLLGALPLALDIRKDADGGKPTVVNDPDGAIARNYKLIATNTAIELARQQTQQQAPEFIVTDD